MSGLRRVRIGNLEVPRARGPLVAGVVNVSPESPQKSSVVAGPKQAYERAARLRDAGASLIDVGGRSSNPAAADVTEAVEARRVLPVVERSPRPTSPSPSTPGARRSPAPPARRERI